MLPQNSVTELQVDYQLTLQDYLRFNFRANYSRLVIKFTVVVGLFVLVIFITVIAQGRFDFSATPALTGIMVIPLLLLIGIPLGIYLNTKKAFNTNAFARKEQHITFNYRGFIARSDSGNSRIAWNEIYKIVELKDILAVYIAQNMAFILPRRVFNNDEHYERLKKIIRENVANKKIK